MKGRTGLARKALVLLSDQAVTSTTVSQTLGVARKAASECLLKLERKGLVDREYVPATRERGRVYRYTLKPGVSLAPRRKSRCTGLLLGHALDRAFRATDG